jgi:anti-sigma factor RsiW
MTATQQHVAPEEVMALLDGELSASEVQSVFAHVDSCAECTKLSEQLRGISLSLSAWKIPTVPAVVERSIAESVAQASSGVNISKPKLSIRAALWSWKQWTAVSVGAMAALLVVASIFTVPLERRVPLQRAGKTMTPFIDIGAQKSQDSMQAGNGGGGDRDSLRAKGGTMGGALGSISGMQAQVPDVLTRNDAPMIARTSFLSIVVKDFSGSRASLDAILARYHGYSAQLSASTAENRARSLQASLRIPAPALASAVADLKTLGRVEKESQSGEEVSQQHTDLVARLKNSRDTEQRLREILQQRTGKISDVLKVEEEIDRVRGEIEQMGAEQKALEHRVDFASVELQLAEEYKAQLNPPAASVSTRIHNAFVAGYENASETVLGVLLFFAEYGPALLIWLAILALPVAIIWRRYRRIAMDT